jgi:hypothetical protein
MPDPIQHVLDRIVSEVGTQLVRLLCQPDISFRQILLLGLQNRV